MQPTVILSAPQDGMIYINGRFAGETGPDRTLIAPVAPWGALYLEYRPLTRAGAALSRKLVFSNGAPTVESLEAAQDISCVLWPLGAAELTLETEIAPDTGEALPEAESEVEGRTLRLTGGRAPRLWIDNRPLCALPEGAQPPAPRRMKHGLALTGRCRGGAYLLTTDRALTRETGFLRAASLEIESEERIRCVAARGDLVGHAALESWQLTEAGLRLFSSEPAWTQGAPHWPETAEDTARAAAEAALENLPAEADGYRAPALRARDPLAGLRERCDLCVRMKYAPPDARPCVGLLTLEGAQLARVRPLYFRAEPSGGPQGPYRLTELEYG